MARMLAVLGRYEDIRVRVEQQREEYRRHTLPLNQHADKVRKRGYTEKGDAEEVHEGVIEDVLHADGSGSQTPGVASTQDPTEGEGDGEVRSRR